MKNLFFALVFLCTFNSPAFCQNNSATSIGAVAKLKSFYSGRIIEKAYLHFDRPNYLAGDTIYFKAYVTYGEQHELSSQSGVLDVDLIDPQNNFLRSIKLQLIDGIASGDFALPGSLPAGHYRIRAYTQLMKDAGVTDFFEQTISVGSGTGNSTLAYRPVENTNKPVIQFFPEGGDLVNGVNSKVAFKALSADGAGINVKGSIVDNAGKTVAGLNSKHLGMGFFYLQPEEGKTYKAHIVFADGTQNVIDLPQADIKGIVLTINNDDPNKLGVLISCNKAYYDENQNKELSLVINSGIAVSSGRIKLTNQLLAIDLKKSQFRTGVVQLTLFSPAGEPTAERLVFVNRPDLLRLNVSANKTSFNPHEKVSISIIAKNKSDSSVAGHFSVSVIDETKVLDEDKENTILSSLLLNSDLKGYIEQPNYYFAHPDTGTAANLDVLMLTQGYRRFAWRQLLADKYSPFTEKPENGLEITGQVTNLSGGPIVKEKVNLIAVDGGPMLNQLTDSAGKFDFTGLDFADGARFILKEGSKKNTTRIIYNRDSPSSITKTDWPYGRQAGLDSTSIKHPSINGSELKVAEAGTISKEYDRSHTPEPASNADQVLHNKDLGDGELTEKLAVLLQDVQYTNGNFYLRANITGTILHPELMLMLVVVDGVKGVSLDGLQTTDVETVEVLKNANASTYGANGSGGVLVVTTKKGKDPVDATTTGILEITPTGFHKAREFYSPKYNNNLPGKQPDQRSTIFWKPELETDKNGNASVDFYNADGKGTYRVVVEGIDNHGNIGRQVYRYTVE
jgi:hypothetical protein